jgi:hypothetical protein
MGIDRMTLVVGRITKGSIAIVADTQITAPGDKPLPMHQGVVKSVLVPGGLCVSFAGSPELAGRDIWDFTKRYQGRWDFGDAVTHFEDRSGRSGVDYLLAFAPFPKLLKIVGGRRIEAVSATQWIGSKDAYEAFRAREARAQKRHYRGRAFPAVLAANTGQNPALDGLYETLREVIAGRCCSSVGGFTSVVVRSGDSFIFPSFSDILYDWPASKGESFDLQLTDPINLSTSGENAEFSVAQFSTAYGDLSIVGFFFPHAGTAYVFIPRRTFVADRCEVIREVLPAQLVDRLNQILNLGSAWRLFVGVSRTVFERDLDRANHPEGISVAIEMLLNTFPASGAGESVHPFQFWLPGPDD